MPYGAFCSLSEYPEVEGFLHISEVAPRWIKNIREFISEGQRHVIKVHHVDKAKNQADVSIKRVNDEEKKRKLEGVQNEKRGKKLLEIALKNAKVKTDFETVKTEIEKEYEDVYSLFKEIAIEGDGAIKDIDLPKPLKAQIIEVAKKSIKKPVVTVDREFSLICYDGQGVETIKKALDIGDAASIHYLGAPKYKISLTAPDYKTAEKKLAALLEDIKDFAQKNHCDFSTERK